MTAFRSSHGFSPRRHHQDCSTLEELPETCISSNRMEEAVTPSVQAVHIFPTLKIF